ncbi:MAG: GNAT family N-acetyltransferase [Pseudomonadota bacterium]
MAELAEIGAEVSFQPAGLAELEALVGFYVELDRSHGQETPEPACRAKVKAMLEVGTHAALITSAGRPIGSVMWRDMGDHWFIRNFTLTASARGRGLGRAAVARLGEIMPGKPIRLEASAEGPGKFWTAQGFTAWSTGYLRDLKEG